MSTTGISVPDEIIKFFKEFKLKKTDLFAITLKIEGSNIVRSEEYKEKDLDKILSSLKDEEPRYILIDWEYETQDGRKADKVVFVSWVSDNSPIKKKFTYGGTKESVKSSLSGISVSIHATDLSELTANIITEACNRY
jgi:cofilin|tara:strand:- start:172 stop:585 length:414 start_codon:yes stop_codon:yes gene_type:complete